MAEIEKAIEEEVVTPDSEEVDIELKEKNQQQLKKLLTRLKNFLKILQKKCLTRLFNECQISY
jgi:hypothetical protein